MSLNEYVRAFSRPQSARDQPIADFVKRNAQWLAFTLRQWGRGLSPSDTDDLLQDAMLAVTVGVRMNLPEAEIQQNIHAALGRASRHSKSYAARRLPLPDANAEVVSHG